MSSIFLLVHAVQGHNRLAFFHVFTPWKVQWDPYIHRLASCWTMTSPAWYCIPYLPRFSAKVSHTCWVLTYQPELFAQFWRVPLLSFTDWDVLKCLESSILSCWSWWPAASCTSRRWFCIRCPTSSTVSCNALALQNGQDIFRLIRLQDAKDTKGQRNKRSRENLWKKSCPVLPQFFGAKALLQKFVQFILGLHKHVHGLSFLPPYGVVASRSLVNTPGDSVANNLLWVW